MISLVLLRNGERIPLVLADRDARSAQTWGLPCPECGAPSLDVRGAVRRVSSDGCAWESDAHAVCCGARVGLLRYQPVALYAPSEKLAVFRPPGRAD